jgi:hypothetical protein
MKAFSMFFNVDSRSRERGVNFGFGAGRLLFDGPRSRMPVENVLRNIVSVVWTGVYGLWA